MKYVTKPVVVDAFQIPVFKSESGDFLAWAEKTGFTYWKFDAEGKVLLEGEDGEYEVPTLGTWIICDGPDSFHSYPDELFQESFELTH